VILTRRGLFELGAAGVARLRLQPGGSSRLGARPGSPASSIAPGEHVLGLEKDRDGLLRIPGRYRPDRPAPLAVLLHGAGGRARRVVSLLGVAESLGVIVLAPESRAGTWDAIRGDFGPDVDFVNRALVHAFARCSVDRGRIAIGGFSDGASYALSLGLDNGDVFTHVLAFSPGFIPGGSRQGRASRGPQGGGPRVFVSHGRQDEILPIGSTSRRVVPALESRGYSVNYREFDGPHTVPPEIAHEGFLWFTR
jgi:phospholipase/carboxylesterase